MTPKQFNEECTRFYGTNRYKTELASVLGVSRQTVHTLLKSTVIPRKYVIKWRKYVKDSAGLM